MIPFHLSTIQIVTLVVSLILPLITAAITGLKTHPGIKAVVLVVLSAATGFGSTLLAALTAGSRFDVTHALLVALVALFIGINAHFGLWKPSTLSTILQSAGPTLFESSADGTPSVTNLKASKTDDTPAAPELVLPAGAVVATGSDPVTVAPSA